MDLRLNSTFDIFHNHTKYFPEDGIQTGLILISFLVTCFLYLIYKSRCKRLEDIYQDDVIKRSQCDPVPIWDWSCKLLKYRKRKQLMKKFANLLPPKMEVQESRMDQRYMIFWLRETKTRCSMVCPMSYSDIAINRTCFT